MNDTIVQIFLGIFGISATFLIARKNKWGFVIGLLAQPFWFITSYTHDQWGIFAISIAYTISWIYGLYEWFLAPTDKKS
ncbi:MAG: nicotinamide mononucleotide transporter [bacterium]